jgi:hypothetical protein
METGLKMGYRLAPYWIPLELFIQSRILSGYIHCSTELRLLDLLNSTRASTHDAGREFLEFINISTSGEGHTQQEGLREYIRKAAIQLIAISDANLARGAGGKGSAKLYPFVPKSAVPVSLQLQTYVLTGCVHCSQGQNVCDVLNEDRLFIPLTGVTIAYQHGLYATRPFVAVNKEQVTSSKEEDSVTVASL